VTELVLSSAIQQAQEELIQCYRELQTKSSNVVWEILQNYAMVYQWDHYPKDEVFGKPYHGQYYYHSHPSKDKDRVIEHGHFHVFFRLAGVPQECKPLYFSEKYKKDSNKDNLCHLFAIAMNDKGLPTSLFTTNHWVTQGIWYAAEDCCKMLELFHVDSPKGPILTNRWINAMVKLFKEPLRQLLLHRDQVMQEWLEENKSKDIYIDKNLEVISVCPLV